MIYYLPIEPLHERYTEQMCRWVQDELDFLGVQYSTILPSHSYEQIKEGQWLDAVGTSRFKANQIALLLQLPLQTGDVILLGDVWFPGIEALAYIRDLTQRRFRIIGWHYAGMFDPADLLARNLGRWGEDFERSIFGLIDAVCVGSDYHLSLLKTGLVGERTWGSRLNIDKIDASGLVWRPEEVAGYYTAQKEKFVVFPHRIAPEKGIFNFYRLAEELKDTGWKFFISTSSTQEFDIPRSEHVTLVRHSSKAEYYRFLNSCSIFYSAATQETFGYALHEAIALGLSIAAPARCSYPEMLQGRKEHLYHDDLGVDLVRSLMERPQPADYDLTKPWGNSWRYWLHRELGVEVAAR